MPYFRKKPVVIEAWRYPESPTVYDNAFLHRWINDHGGKTQVTKQGNAIQTLEGLMLISPGDWIVQGTEGEFYPVKPNAFEATFEEVSLVEKPT